jgi:hypothetical protein
MPEADLLTVQEASEALGIHEKRLRRLLARAEYKDRTQTGTRETRTGTRTVILLSSQLLADIRVRLDMYPSTGNGDNRDTYRDEDNADRDKATPQNTMVRVSVAGLTAIYEQRLEAQRETYEKQLAAKDEVLSEKDKTIAAKDETIVALREALNQRPAPAGGDSSSVSSSGGGITPPSTTEGKNRGFWSFLRRIW